MWHAEARGLKMDVSMSGSFSRPVLELLSEESAFEIQRANGLLLSTQLAISVTI